MDTSKEYVEMCRKAEEIQAMRPTHTVSMFSGEQMEAMELFEEGDYIASDKYDAYVVLNDRKQYGPVGMSWLPRQDQLQEMAFTEVKSAVHILRWLDAFTAKNFDTLEKYTLCAVMYTLYDKEWNGEEWVQD